MLRGAPAPVNRTTEPPRHRGKQPRWPSARENRREAAAAALASALSMILGTKNVQILNGSLSLHSSWSHPPLCMMWPQQSRIVSRIIKLNSIYSIKYWITGTQRHKLPLWGRTANPVILIGDPSTKFSADLSFIIFTINALFDMHMRSNGNFFRNMLM